MKSPFTFTFNGIMKPTILLMARARLLRLTTMTCVAWEGLIKLFNAVNYNYSTVYESYIL